MATGFWTEEKESGSRRGVTEGKNMGVQGTGGLDAKD